jgi:hypothetical protein
VTAEGQEGAVRLAVHHVRIARGPAGGIDEDAFRRGPALVAGDAHLAHRDGARRHVEEQRRLPVGAGQGDADGIGGEARVAAPEGRDEPPVVGDVDEVQRDEAGGAGHLAVRPDAADVMGVRERHRHHAGLAAARDGGGHGLAGDRPAVAAAAVEHQRRAVVLHQLHARVRHDEARLEVPDIGGDHPDAVAVVAGQVRLHEVLGDEVGFGGGAAARFQDRAAHPPQPIGTETHSSGHVLLPVDVDSAAPGRSRPRYSITSPGSPQAPPEDAGETEGPCQRPAVHSRSIVGPAATMVTATSAESAAKAAQATAYESQPSRRSPNTGGPTRSPRTMEAKATPLRSPACPGPPASALITKKMPTQP